MKIAVLSDILAQIDNLQQNLDLIDGKVETITFCGDMVSLLTAGSLIKS